MEYWKEYLSNDGHGNNCKVEEGDITPPQMDVSKVTHLQATDPGVTLLGRRQSGGKIVKNACSDMGAVKFNDEKFEDFGHQVIDPSISSRGCRRGDSRSTSESNPKQTKDEVVVVGVLVNEVPGYIGEEVEEKQN